MGALRFQKLIAELVWRYAILMKLRLTVRVCAMTDYAGSA
jgi:hypothetical protein